MAKTIWSLRPNSYHWENADWEEGFDKAILARDMTTNTDEYKYL